jgi:hypothetical protein
MRQSLKSSTKSKTYTLPTGYGIIHDGDYRYLVMEYLEGPTMWEVMGNGAHELLEDCANKIAAVVQELRQSLQLCESLLKLNALTPLVHWYPQSTIFVLDNDGGRVLDDITDFIGFMNHDRSLPRSWSQLECRSSSPKRDHSWRAFTKKLKLCPDGINGIMDLQTTFVTPTWWKYYALHAAHYGPKYTNPLKKAMVRYGMDASSEIIDQLDFKFIPWFAKLGGAWSR